MLMLLALLTDVTWSLVREFGGESTLRIGVFARWILVGLLAREIWPKGSRHQRGSFGHWLADRRHREDMAGMFAERERLLARDLLVPPGCDDLVDDMLGGDFVFAPLRLKQQGERAVPALERGLGDPRCRPGVEDSSDLSRQSEDPWFRTLDLLERFGSRDALAHVVPFLQDARRSVRRRALQFCAASGEPAAVEASLAELDGPDGSDVAHGIRTAADAGRITAEQRELVFRRLLARVDAADGAKGDVDILAAALISLDPVSATTELTAPARFHPREPSFAGVLKALKSAGLSVSGPRLRELLDEIRGTKSEGRTEHGRLLGMLVAARHPDAEALCRSAVSTGEGQVAEAGALGLCTLRGMESPTKHVARRLQEVGFAGLSEPQRVVWAANRLLWRVSNGGLANVYSNGAGKECDYRHRAFEAIGVPELAGVVREADAAFGPDGPPPGEREREDAVGKKFDELRDAWQPLERRYWDLSDRARVRIYTYALEHPADFGG